MQTRRTICLSDMVAENKFIDQPADMVGGRLKKGAVSPHDPHCNIGDSREQLIAWINRRKDNNNESKN